MTTYTTILKNQTPLDIALILTGSADNAYEIAKESEIDMSNMLKTGEQIYYNGEITDKRVFEYYAARGIRPATGIDTLYSGAIKIFDSTFAFTFE